MPYPTPDDPDYCQGSREPVEHWNPLKQWHRCPHCHRPIAAMANGAFYPHVLNRRRARRQDQIQEGLMAHGYDKKINRREAPDS